MRSTLFSESSVHLLCECRCRHYMSISLASSTACSVPRLFPSFRGWVLGVPWRFSVSPILCRHQRSLLLSRPSWALVYGWSETARTWEIPMHSLLPRSLPSPILYNPGGCSGPPRSSFCGGLRRLSSGLVCCSSERSEKDHLWPDQVVVMGCALVIAPLWALAFVVPSILG